MSDEKLKIGDCNENDNPCKVVVTNDPVNLKLEERVDNVKVGLTANLVEFKDKLSKGNIVLTFQGKESYFPLGSDNATFVIPRSEVVSFIGLLREVIDKVKKR